MPRIDLPAAGLLRGVLILLVAATATCLAEEEYTSPRSKEACLAYRASPFSQLSMDYFARFSRDPQAAPSEKEMVIGRTWRIRLLADAPPLTELMAGHLRDFLNQRMALNVSIERRSRDGLSKDSEKTITLLASGLGGTSPARESFSITVEPQALLKVRIRAISAAAS